MPELVHPRKPQGLSGRLYGKLSPRSCFLLLLFKQRCEDLLRDLLVSHLLQPGGRLISRLVPGPLTNGLHIKRVVPGLLPASRIDRVRDAEEENSAATTGTTRSSTPYFRRFSEARVWPEDGAGPGHHYQA